MKSLLLAALVGSSLGLAPAVGDDGAKLPSSKLEIHQSLAETMGDLEGRALLIEFFAHW